jgi:hypothetical protein
MTRKRWFEKLFMRANIARQLLINPDYTHRLGLAKFLGEIACCHPQGQREG